jgi:hypothetical protein
MTDSSLQDKKLVKLLALSGPLFAPQPRTLEILPDMPTDLRLRLETARLVNLCMLRALDRCGYDMVDAPSVLLEIFELDADYAEGLWGLDQPQGEEIDHHLMLADLEESLAAQGEVREEFFEALGKLAARIQGEEWKVAPSLEQEEAYSQVPGREGVV